MGFKKGLDANIKTSFDNKSGGIQRLTQILSQVQGGMQVGRVTDIILNAQYPNIEQYGGVNAIGTILFELTDSTNQGEASAIPFFPQMSSYPLVNEMVLIFKLPTSKIGLNINNKGYYYINMLNLWNHPHHNAYPNTSQPLDPTFQVDYEKVTAGAVRRVTDGKTEINLNSPIATTQQTFKERMDIHPLLPFAGDTIYEGRWGNSIRLGSTAKSLDLNHRVGSKIQYLNDWSNSGKNGDPLIILRNGQNPDNKEAGYMPCTEDINMDLSSIYLTSTQKIPILQPTYQNFFSYSNTEENPTPQSIGTFEKPQVIINSNRIVLNAKSDHILLSGEKSISLSSNKSINFDSKKFTIDSNDIKLGSNSATQPIVKGNTLYNDLYFMITGLIQIVKVLEDAQMWPGGAPTPDAGVSSVASITSHTLTNTRDNLKKILSTKVKTL